VAEREAYARTVGEDGFALLDRLDRPGAPEGLRSLPAVGVLRRVWARHFVRQDGAPPGGGARLRAEGRPAARGGGEPVESPYDPEARFRTRSGTSWTGYVVHLSETCEDDTVHLITHAMTTAATVHEARCTAAIHAALAGKGLAPGEHLVDAAYVDAELLVRGREELGIDLLGPPRPNPSWQAKVEGGHTLDRFEVDWEQERVRCPQGRLSSAWTRQVDQTGTPYVSVMFRPADCGACPARPLCTRAGHRARHLKLPPRAEHGALRTARERLGTKEGRRRYARRAGIEGTISQGVRAFGPTPQPLPRAGQDPPAARGDRGRGRPRTARRLVPGDSPCRHPYVALRRPRRGLSRLRQRYPIVCRRCWSRPGSTASPRAGARPTTPRAGAGRRCRRAATSACTWSATSRASTASAAWSGAAPTACPCASSCGSARSSRCLIIPG
jgi:hypothetical protein